ncbi:MAG TPA: low molecular weight protein-tyrosine-phosphatase, partial [Roseiflexaceae bacterium]|nr:low molecular weight protein-tyrosine-phosphatase [Roseiflexaceae bacterium]
GHLVAQAGLSDRIEVDSAGTGAWHIGEQPHHGTRRVLRERGIEYSHRARTVAASDFSDFDYIVALDSENLADLRALARGNHTHVMRLLDYAPDARVRDVPDPYYNGRFDEVYELVEQGGRGLLERIVREHKLSA